MFQIVNHEIPSDVIRKLQNVGKEFFELPQEEKELIAKPAGSDSIEGYGTKLQKEVNGKKGWVDHLFHIVWPPSSIDYRYWPKNPPSYREVNEEYCRYLRGVVDKLFKSLVADVVLWMNWRGAVAVLVYVIALWYLFDLEENQLKKVTNGDEMHYLLKINYYPPCPCPNLVLGVPTLTDMSYLTILVPNEVQGLQVCRDGHCMIRSNGKYKAVFHRTTVNKYETRMSWPVFIKPKKEHEVGPHPKLVNQDNPSKYKTKIYKDYAYSQNLGQSPQTFIPSFVFVLAVTFTVKCLHVCTHGLYLNAMV
ncbi:hypothetical protein JHK85_040987 [Glycine max]|nr:hypothetical protein JHK86_040402 [Glycine max]KAG4966012.1 hypothetical protein JHK85_040987 [Glycine max]